jgi:hypothetical protein
MLVLDTWYCKNITHNESYLSEFLLSGIILPASFFSSSDIMYTCQVKDNEVYGLLGCNTRLVWRQPHILEEHIASILRVKE